MAREGSIQIIQNEILKFFFHCLFCYNSDREHPRFTEQHIPRLREQRLHLRKLLRLSSMIKRCTELDVQNGLTTIFPSFT